MLSEKLFIRQQAIHAWKAYLKLDSSSAWEGEAERHLQAIEKPTLAEIWPAKKRRLSEAATTGDTATVQEIVREAPQASRKTSKKISSAPGPMPKPMAICQDPPAI